MGKARFNTLTVFLEVLSRLEFGRNVPQIKICCWLFRLLHELDNGDGLYNISLCENEFVSVL